MTEPVSQFITLVGAPGAACEGDACLPDVPPAAEPSDSRPEDPAQAERR